MLHNERKEKKRKKIYKKAKNFSTLKNQRQIE